MPCMWFIRSSDFCVSEVVLVICRNRSWLGISLQLACEHLQQLFQLGKVCQLYC